MRSTIKQIGSGLVFLLVLLAVGCEGWEHVRLPLNEGSLEGIYWRPAKELSPAVLLVQAGEGSGGEWIPFGDRLRQRGYGVLALALRGDAEAEVAAGFNFLREQKRVDAARLGIVGVGPGAAAALRFSTREPLVRALVLVSPPEAGPEDRLGDAVAYYGWRPILFAAGRDDINAPRVEELSRRAHGPTVVQLYETDAQGLPLLQATPPLEQTLLEFLGRHLSRPILDTRGGGG